MKINCIHNICLKNFKNFTYIDASFEDCLKSDKESIAFIYGGNGVGKSNLISSLYFLYELNNTLSLNLVDMRLLSKYRIDNPYDFEMIGKRQQELLNSNSKKIINKYKRKGSKDEIMTVKVTLTYKGVYYEYTVSCDDEKIIKEELLFRDNVRLTTAFSLDQGSFYLSNSIFFDTRFRDLINLELEQKFGNHTLIALLSDLTMKNNKSYMINNLSLIIRNFLVCMDDIDIIKNNMVGDSNIELIKSNDKILPNLLSGKIIDDGNAEEKFNISTNFMNIFYKKYLPEIKYIYYNVVRQDNEINYDLHFVRSNVYGKDIDIAYNEESFGNIAFTTLISIFYKVLNGQIIILDDIYMGLHDTILIDIMDDVSDMLHEYRKQCESKIVGQLIIITQNTIFMNYEKRNNIYLLENLKGEKNSQFIVINKFNKDVQKSSNIRKRYIEDINSGIKYSSGDRTVNLNNVRKILNRYY